MATPAIGPYNYGPIELDTQAQRATLGSGAAVANTGGAPIAAGLSGLSGLALLAYASNYSNGATDNAALAAHIKGYLENIVSAQQYNAEDGFRERRTAPGSVGPSGPASEMPSSKPDDGTLINQGAYRGVPLGYGARSISQSGCGLASLTVMSNRLNNRSMDLNQSNQRVMDAGGFVQGTSDMDITKGARALGLEPTGERVAATPANVDHAIGALNSGNPPQMVLAKVTHVNNEGVTRPHFLALEQERNGTISAADSAGGQRIQFRRGQDGNWQEVPQNGVFHGYKLESVQSFRGAAPNSPELAAFRNPIVKA